MIWFLSVMARSNSTNFANTREQGNKNPQGISTVQKMTDVGFPTELVGFGC